MSALAIEIKMPVAESVSVTDDTLYVRLLPIFTIREDLSNVYNLHSEIYKD